MGPRPSHNALTICNGIACCRTDSKCALLPLAGFFLVLANKSVSKQVALWLLPAFYALYPLALRRLWQPPMHTVAEQHGLGLAEIPCNEKGVPWDADITARFLAYASIGWTVTNLTVRLFDVLHW